MGANRKWPPHCCWRLEIWRPEKITHVLKCPLPIPEEFLKSAFMFKFVVQFRKQVGPSNWGRGAVLSWLYSASSCMCLCRLSNPSRPCLLSVGREPHPRHFPECSHSVPTWTGLRSDITGCSVFSGSLAFRVVHVLAYHSELGVAFPKVQGIKYCPNPYTRLSAAWKALFMASKLWGIEVDFWCIFKQDNFPESFILIM